MTYTIGISSGFFKADPNVMGIPKKLQFGITQGVNFVQVDLESITEFKEPDLKAKVKRAIEFGAEFGIHGETGAFGGGSVFQLDNALEDEYIRSHERLIISLEEAGKLGSKYYLLHSSETTPFIQLGMSLQPTKLVDFWGRPLPKLFENDEKIKSWILKSPYLWEHMRIMDPMQEIEDNFEAIKRRALYDKSNAGDKNPQLTSDEEKKLKKHAREEILNNFIKYLYMPNQVYGAERVAYYIVAKYMEINNDSLWKSITKNKSIDDDKFRADFRNWVPAVSAKYWWGHLNPKDSRFKDPKPILEKYKIYMIIETPTGFSGGEDLGRFSRPLHMSYLAENVGTKYFGLAIDFEHMLGNNIDPIEEIKQFSAKGGKYVRVLHLGYPTPLHTAHQSLDLGSDEQKYIYERIWELRQKDFIDGWIIFERAKAEDIKTSILSIRMIKKFLELNTNPKDLPLEFYGLEQTGAEVRRQELAIKQHAFDPLKGTLSIPEEEFGFFSTEAQKKGKLKEWSEGEYK